MGCANGRDEKTTQDGELTKERQLSRKSTVKQAQDKADYSLKKSENKEDLLNSLVEN